MYLEELRPLLSQGDVFTQIDLLDSALPDTPERKDSVIVLSHTCEILKPENNTVLVSVVRPILNLDKGNQGHIRKNRTFGSMYLMSFSILQESFVDFRLTFRVHKSILQEALLKKQRIVSLNDKAQLALAHYFYRFLVRKKPRKNIKQWFLNIISKVKNIF